MINFFSTNIMVHLTDLRALYFKGDLTRAKCVIFKVGRLRRLDFLSNFRILRERSLLTITSSIYHSQSVKTTKHSYMPLTRYQSRFRFSWIPRMQMHDGIRSSCSDFRMSSYNSIRSVWRSVNSVLELSSLSLLLAFSLPRSVPLVFFPTKVSSRLSRLVAHAASNLSACVGASSCNLGIACKIPRSFPEYTTVLVLKLQDFSNSYFRTNKSPKIRNSLF